MDEHRGGDESAGVYEKHIYSLEKCVIKECGGTLPPICSSSIHDYIQTEQYVKPNHIC